MGFKKKDAERSGFRDLPGDDDADEGLVVSAHALDSLVDALSEELGRVAEALHEREIRKLQIATHLKKQDTDRGGSKGSRR